MPKEEQPYELPGNWAWVRLGNITAIVGGGTPSSQVTEYYEGGKIPWVSPADLSDFNEKYISSGRKHITELGLLKSSARMLPKGTVLLSSRAPIGYVAITANELCTNQGFKSFLPSKVFMPDFLYWFLKSNKEKLESYASGTTFLELSGARAAQILFPLPPLAEQKRIVERIEGLFSKLDEAKELIQSSLERSQLRRSAILHAAFTGQLTEQWRKENGVSKESWKEKQFTDIAEIKSNLVTPLDYPNLPHVAPDNIEKKTGRLLDYKSVAEDAVKSPNHLFFPGQILYSKIRPYLSKLVFVDFKGLCSADMYPIEAKGNVAYLKYYMLSDAFLNQASSSGSRSVLPKINQKELSIILIPYPSLPEQHEIVRILDSLLQKEDAARELCEGVLEKIELTRKSILAQAFRGHLGTNNPNDPSALDLLEKVFRDSSTV